MSHVIKWKSQPARRSASWSITIFSARREINKIRADVPSLSQDYLESIWHNCFQIAVKNAEDEMGKQSEITALSWAEVFETEYTWVQPD